ncbi:MAG: M23 family metallopeptidase [Candidatus Neomarinimicrobiota bacterium]|nr:MAG: M23 family metallopeptidase [Candidatus Neomarinimicrobiota bacterium]
MKWQPIDRYFSRCEYPLYREMTLRNLLCLVGLTGGLFGQSSLLWPTNAGKELSSNFAEYRSDHYHTGIDIKAGGAPGAKAFAVADGYVSRIATNFTGYGKALYLTTDDGKIAVYAHLESLFPELEDVLRIQQAQAGSYFVDVQFKPQEFPVHRGDVLGIVGDRGYSFGRHLHFEIRNSRERPLNPLLEGFGVIDHLSPLLSRLVVIPLDSGATVNASALPQIVPLYFDRTGVYLPPDTLQVEGPVGLAVEVEDRIQGVPNRYQIQRIRMEVDSTLVFRKKYQQLDFSRSRRINLDRDYRLYRYHLGSFQRLFVNPEGAFPAIGDGRLQLTPGLHQVDLVASDAAGNSARARIMVYSGPPRTIQVELLSRQPDTCRFLVRADTSLALHKLTVYSFTGHGYADLKEELSTRRRGPGEWQVALPAWRCERKALQFLAQFRGGLFSYPVHWIPEKLRNPVLDTRVSLDVDMVEGGVHLQLETSQTVAAHPVVYLYFGPDGRVRSIPVHQIQPTVYLSERLRPAELDRLTRVDAILRDQQEKITRFTVLPRYVDPTRRTEIYSPDHACSMLIEPDRLYAPAVAWIERVARTVDPPTGRRLTPAYQLQPFDVPLKQPVKVALQYPEPERFTANMALFYFDDEKEKWTYLETRRNDRKNLLLAEVESLDAVTVIQDSLPPVMNGSFPADQGMYRSEDVQVIRARFEDDLAGIRESEAGIIVTLDGTRLWGDYQPVKQEFRYDLVSPLAPGPHQVHYRVLDQTGNEFQTIIHFQVE